MNLINPSLMHAGTLAGVRSSRRFSIIAVGIIVLLAGLAHGQSQATQPSTQPAWRFEIVDENGAATAARVVVYSRADQRYLVPRGAVSWLALNQPGRYRGAEYFCADGGFALNTGADTLFMVVRKGLEYAIFEQDIKRGDGPTTIRLKRAIDMNARGYFSGDGHIHPASGTPDWARVGGRASFHDPTVITNELLSTITRAEDLDYANLLASNAEDDTVHFGHRVTGTHEPESDSLHHVRISEEYRSEVYGHMSVFGIRRLSDPVFTALPGSHVHPHDYPTNHEALLKYAAQEAFPTFAHLRRQRNLALECPIDVALGSLNAVEIQGYAVAPRNAADLWEKLMNCGFNVVLSAGTDSTLTFVKNLPPGGARVYVDLEGQPFSHERWVSQLAKGKAFTTNGAMLFLTVDGKKPGQTIALETGTADGRAKPRTVPVQIAVESLFPWDTVTLRMNGADALVFKSADGNPLRQEFAGEITVSEPAWIYAHVAGPISDHVHQGINPWWEPAHDAFTNAIWVTVPGRLRRDQSSCQFMIDWIGDNLDTLEQRNNYGSPENRTKVRATFLRALEVFEQRKAEASDAR